MADWSGSERQRKPQGECRPPSRPANLQSKFTIPAGTKVLIQPITDPCKLWSHTTTRELGFDKCEGNENGEGKFREQGYFLFVRWSLVVRREGGAT